MKPRALVTLVLGKEYESLAAISHPLMKQYAEMLNADFIVIDQPIITRQFPNLPVHYEKFQLHGFLQKYDRVLFLDTDTLVRPGCPSLFDLVPRADVGAYLVSRHSSIHDQDIIKVQQTLGTLDWQRKYFNTGVLVLSREHAGIFDFAHGSYVGYGEQTQINYNVRKLQFNIHDITYRFNHTTAPGTGCDRFYSQIIHYPGAGHVQYFRRLSKEAQILHDLATIKKLDRRDPFVRLFVRLRSQWDLMSVKVVRSMRQLKKRWKQRNLKH